MTDEQAWLIERRTYLGGTDAAALAGINPPRWRQPIDVYLEKLGLAPERPPSRMMSLGRLMEQLVADLAAEATGLVWRRPPGPVRSRQHPWMGGNVDRYGPGCILECKWTQRADGWGPSFDEDDPDDEPTRPRIPLHYGVQVQHYLAVTGRELAIVAVLIGYADFRWYRVPRDELMIAALTELEDRFWHDNVLAQVPPAPDGSAGYGQHLRRLYPADDGSEAVATPEQHAMIAALHRADAQLAVVKREREQAAQRLMASMGPTQRLVAPDATITWRQTGERRTIDWQALVALRLADDMGTYWPATKKAQAEALMALATRLGHVTAEPGPRPFRVHYSDEEDPDGT